MFYFHHYVGEAPCNGEGSEDSVGPHPQRVQGSVWWRGGIPQKFLAGNKEFGEIMILMTT